MSYLESLIADHIRELSGVEFKIAAYVYRLLDSQAQVQRDIPGFAKATGVSTRQAQSALKSLARKGILKVDSTPKRGTCCWLPAAVKVKQVQSKPATRKRASLRPPQPVPANPPVTPPSPTVQPKEEMPPTPPAHSRIDRTDLSGLWEKIQRSKREW